MIIATMMITRGPTLEWRLSHVNVARGCVVSVTQDSVETCSPEHACENFDCSYLVALRHTLFVIQANSGVPETSFLLNAGDVSMEAERHYYYYS